MDELRIDSHKLIFHPRRVADWLGGSDITPIWAEYSLTNRCNCRCVFCYWPYLLLLPLPFVPSSAITLASPTLPRPTHPLCSYLDARDPSLARLRQLSHSPAAWFRCPFAHVVLVSCLEVGAGAGSNRRKPAQTLAAMSCQACGAACGRQRHANGLMPSRRCAFGSMIRA